MKLNARFFSRVQGSGSHNMAVDEALGLCIDAGPPVIRFYGFSPPTLSIGRFQQAKDVFDFKRLGREGFGFVRRPTGGQAVLHDNELTYSVVLSKKHLSPFRKRVAYRFLSEILIEGLSNLGISADFSRNRLGDSHNPDCFGTTGQFEIVTSKGKKIIGSAQSMSRLSCLQHGSIPLINSQPMLSAYFLTPPPDNNRDATSIEEELCRPATIGEVSDAFFKAFERVYDLRPSEMTTRERTTAEELLHSKYTSDAWNLKL